MNVKPLSEQRLARRKELADALRSGDYKRGNGQLQTPTGTYCCLGVACRVAEDHGVKVRQHVGGLHAGKLFGPTLSHHQPNVERYYGFTQHEQTELAHTNDSFGSKDEYKYSWDTIADAIETGKYHS
jgi:hypothetical protein